MLKKLAITGLLVSELVATVLVVNKAIHARSRRTPFTVWRHQEFTGRDGKVRIGSYDVLAINKAGDRVRRFILTKLRFDYREITFHNGLHTRVYDDARVLSSVQYPPPRKDTVGVYREDCRECDPKHPPAWFFGLKLDKLQLGEPDPALFKIPEGYTEMEPSRASEAHLRAGNLPSAAFDKSPQPPARIRSHADEFYWAHRPIGR